MLFHTSVTFLRLQDTTEDIFGEILELSSLILLRQRGSQLVSKVVYEEKKKHPQTSQSSNYQNTCVHMKHKE